MRTLRFTLAVASVISVSGLPAQAALITGITATATSTASGSAQAVVDGAGLDASGHHSTNAADMWVSVGNGSAGLGTDANPSITFDLGRAYALATTMVWNYNATNGSQNLNYRGVRIGTIEGSQDGLSYTPVVADYGFRPAPGIDYYNFGEAIPLNTTARFIRFTALTPYGQYDDLGEVGLSEVQFDGEPAPGPTAVPEPASLAMLGFGMLGLLATRRGARRG